jgi:hypothetical protein
MRASKASTEKWSQCVQGYSRCLSSSASQEGSIAKLGHLEAQIVSNTVSFSRQAVLVAADLERRVGNPLLGPPLSGQASPRFLGGERRPDNGGGNPPRSCLQVCACVVFAIALKPADARVWGGFSDWFGLLAGACPHGVVGIEVGRGYGGVQVFRAPRAFRF